jgi:hypothetical protein
MYSWGKRNRQLAWNRLLPLKLCILCKNMMSCATLRWQHLGKTPISSNKWQFLARETVFDGSCRLGFSHGTAAVRWPSIAKYYLLSIMSRDINLTLYKYSLSNTFSSIYSFSYHHFLYTSRKKKLFRLH